MRADLLGASSASPVFALTHLGPPGHTRERLDVFAAPERAAIIAYLRACQASYQAREIQHALDAYWLR